RPRGNPCSRGNIGAWSYPRPRGNPCSRGNIGAWSYPCPRGNPCSRGDFGARGYPRPRYHLFSIVHTFPGVHHGSPGHPCARGNIGPHCNVCAKLNPCAYRCALDPSTNCCAI
ncbi:unnamed protein product, partial [Discosporangium mesarthrocarpum]